MSSAEQTAMRAMNGLHIKCPNGPVVEAHTDETKGSRSSRQRARPRSQPFFIGVAGGCPCILGAKSHYLSRLLVQSHGSTIQIQLQGRSLCTLKLGTARQVARLLGRRQS